MSRSSTFLTGLFMASVIAACSSSKQVGLPGAEDGTGSDPTEQPVLQPGDDPADGPADGPGDVPVDPETGEPVPQVITTEVKAQFGFVITIPAGARVLKNGIVDRCFTDQVGEPEHPASEPVADAGVPVGDAGVVLPPPAPPPPPAAPAAPPVTTCVKQFELTYAATYDVAGGEGRLYDLNLIINPVDDGRNPAIVTLASENPDGSVAVTDNISGGTTASGWVTNATALRPASNGNEYQFQLNAQVAPDTALLKSMFRDVLKDLRVVPIAK